jgi:hypothetical protein
MLRAKRPRGGPFAILPLNINAKLNPAPILSSKQAILSPFLHNATNCAPNFIKETSSKFTETLPCQNSRHIFHLWTQAAQEIAEHCVQVQVHQHAIETHCLLHIFLFWTHTQDNYTSNLSSTSTMAKFKASATRSKQPPARAATGKAAKAPAPEASRSTKPTKEPISVDSDEEIEDVTPTEEQVPPADDEQRREDPRNTNDFINDINNPKDDESIPADSPSKSPVKKKSKREALAGLFTNRPATAAPADQPAKEPSPTNNSNTTPKETTEANKAASKRPASSLKEGKYSGKSAGPNKPTTTAVPVSIKKPHVHKFQRTVMEGAIDFRKDALLQYAPNRCKTLPGDQLSHKANGNC